MNFFGGGFTGPPNSQCKLRQNMPQGQQFTSPVRQLGTVPVAASFGVQPTIPAAPAPLAPPLHVVPPRSLGVQPPQNVQGLARPVVSAGGQPPPAMQHNSPIGPSSYKVMKKGEAPCPICRG